jgi:hypothetical protein
MGASYCWFPARGKDRALFDDALLTAAKEPDAKLQALAAKVTTA